jgi:ankyrin repeat protein
MLAAVHKRHHAYSLLLNPYGANPTLRDYSGKLAEHYMCALVRRGLGLFLNFAP